MKLKKIFGEQSYDLSSVDTKVVDSNLLNLLEELVTTITYKDNSKEYILLLNAPILYTHFKNPKDIVEISIGCGVNGFGEGCFADMDNLNTLTFYCDVFSFATQKDYENWGNVKCINLNGKGITNIPKNAFEDSNIEKISLPPNLLSIESSAISNCPNLSSVIIPNSVTSIGSGVFFRCPKITSIEIPKNVNSIGGGVNAVPAFGMCNGIYKINVDIENKTLDSRDNCNAIIETSSNKLVRGFNNTIIPNSVTSIGNHAFSNMEQFTTIHIPNGVKTIGDYAFFGCSSLTSIDLGEGVTSIGQYAFVNTKLKALKIPNSVNSIGYKAFQGCRIKKEDFVNNSSLNNLNDWGINIIDETIDGLIINHNNIIIECNKNSVVVNIPNSVTSIGNYAFKGCTSLTSVTIPNSVLYIGQYAFCDTIINEIIYNGTIEQWNILLINSNIRYSGELINTDSHPYTIENNKRIFCNVICNDGTTYISQSFIP